MEICMFTCISLSISWYGSPICACGTSIWCKCLLWELCWTWKMAHSTREDLSMFSWSRKVLAPLDVVGIHHHILSRSGLHDASSDHRCPESLASLFGPSVKCDLNSLKAYVCPWCNLCEHQSSYFCLYPEWICLLHLFSIQTLPVEDAELVGQSFTS